MSQEGTVPNQYYGTAPIQPNDPTGGSRKGAGLVFPNLEKYRQEVFACLKAHGPQTDEQVRNRIGMKPKTTTARRRELELGGVVKKMDFQRVNSRGRKVNVYGVV